MIARFAGMGISEIIVFCYGDSRKLATWSNVPYLFTSTLENKGITVHRVDILPPTAFRKWYNAVVWRLYRFIFRGTQSNDLRSLLCKKIVEKRIRRAVRQFNSADYCLFFGFDYFNRFSSIPTILFGDWTLEIYLKDRLKKKGTDILERRFIRQQNTAIANASLVISLFPDAAAAIKDAVPGANVHYLGTNVVNNASLKDYPQTELLSKKRDSKTILFIGGRNYLSGAELLISAFRTFNKARQNAYTLSIVGLDKEDIAADPADNIHLYGYLDKADAADNDQYYRLLSEAKVIINPTEHWAGYSSIIEAMFYYTPVIVSPFSSFKAEFGDTLSFGKYFTGKQADALAECIQEIIESPRYPEQCIAAHNAVKDYTWDNFIHRLLQLAEDDPTRNTR